MPSRREFLAGVSTVGVSAVAGCLGGPSPDPGTSESYKWPTSGADLRNSRAIPDGIAPRDDPDVDWRVDFDASLVNAEPTVTETTVIVPTGRDVVAIDRSSHEQRWSIDPENEAYSYTGSATVFENTVYIPEVQVLTARDLDTGEIDWSYEFDRPIGRNALAVEERGDGGYVYVAAGNYLTALDATAGDVLWEQELLGRAQYAIAKYADSLYVVTSGGELYNVKQYGEVEWRRTIEAGIRSAPVVLTSSDRRTGQGIAVAAGDGSVVYFDSSGAREWRTEIGGFGDDGIAIGHRTLLARSGSTLFALDANDGSERWRVDLGTGSRNPPILVGDTVYVGGDRLRAIDIDGGIGIRTLRFGEQRFERETSGLVSFVTAADGKLFVTTTVQTADREQAELIVFSE